MRRRVILALMLVVVAAVLVVVAIFQMVNFYAGEEVTLRQPVAASPLAVPPQVSAGSLEARTPEAPGLVVTPAPEPIAASAPTGLQWTRPGTGLLAEFSLGSPLVNSPGEDIVPDGFDTARWVKAPDMGTPSSDARLPVFITGHTHPSKAAVFNPLYDRATSTSYVQVGDEFLLPTEASRAAGADPLRYIVTGVKDYPKGVVETDAENEIWQIVPGRLVIVTCFQNPSGTRSTDNFVVFAQLAD